MDHILRLENSAHLIGLNLPHSIDEIYKLVMETIERNNHKEFNVRLVVTGGLSPSNYIPDDNANLIIMVTAINEIAASCYSDGVKVITTHTERFMPGSKSINYIPAILAMREARERNALEAIYVDRNGYIQEGTTSNFFAIFGNTLVTPPTDRLLPGVTRQTVLELAKDHFEIEIRNIHKDEVSLMNEALITASNKEIIPVHTIDAIQLTAGVGNHAKKLMNLFREHTLGYQG